MPQESLPGVTAPENTGRKHAYGERGHHVGRWPKKGPFTILVRDRARKDANAPSKGEKFYNCDLIRARKEPKIGFNAYLGARHGEGWYKIVSSDQPRGALFRITERMEETARKRYPKLALEGEDGDELDELDELEDDEVDEVDEEDDDEPEPARANPDPIAAILEQRRQYEQLAKLFEPRDNPSPLAAMLANPAALGVLAKLFEAPPKPPPQAPQLDPEAVEWLKVAAELRARNLTPADALAAFQTVPPPGAPVADGDGADGADGEDVGPDGEPLEPIDPFDAARARYMRPR